MVKSLYLTSVYWLVLYLLQ